jgi:hypothetical protein
MDCQLEVENRSQFCVVTVSYLISRSRGSSLESPLPKKGGSLPVAVISALKTVMLDASIERRFFPAAHFSSTFPTKATAPTVLPGPNPLPIAAASNPVVDRQEIDE